MKHFTKMRSTTTMLLTLCFLLFSAIGFSQTVVTKTYSAPSSVSVDGCGSYCTIAGIPGVTFSASDFTAGACQVTDVNVNIVWAKTDGTCTAPGTANSFHSETNFRIDGPTGNNVVLVQPGTYTGTATMSTVSTTFNQGAPIVGGATPFSGTFSPNNGNLNTFNGTNPFGTWRLKPGDTGGGDPLCIISYSVTVTVSTGIDTDGDGTCDAIDTDDDNDGVADASDPNTLDPNICGDADADGCDDCSVGTDDFGPLADNNTANDGTDTDGDGICDSGDTDDDNDGVADVSDPNSLDPNICGDADADGCDDCSVGTDDFGPLPDNNTANDGTDTDGDGLCDSGDPDDDNDGVADGMDVNPLSPFLCGDADFDGCDDCAVGVDGFGPLADNTPANDGTDTDGDGLCDLGDPDDDNDGIADGIDSDPLDPFVCQDADADGCDDCSVGVDGFGPLVDASVSNDGVDTDGDGLCDSGDPDDDNDGVMDVADTDPLNPFVCQDVDADGCDDCAVGVDGFGPLPDNDPLNDDNTAPIAVCQNINLYLDGTGNASIVASDIDGGSSDNCGILSFTASTTAFTCTNIGANPVTLTVDDGNGNTASCVATVTVLDTISPVISCSSGVQNTSDDATGDCTFTPFIAGQAGTYTISDNCSSTLTVQEIFTGALVTSATWTLAPGTHTPVQTFPVGVTNVTVIVTDENGNSNTCSYTTTIVDDESPVAACQNLTVYLDGSGTATITAGDVDNGSSDNCGLASISVTPSTFTCANAGANTVTLTATDVNGNAASCSATVTVIDSVAPTAVCQNLTVYLDGSGTATITAGDVDNGSSDNCGLASISVTPSSFTCANVGANTVTLTATDANGNTSDCTATVTVIDSISPTAVCQNITVFLDGSGNASIVAADIDGGSTDNCGTVSLTASQTAFTCANVGTNTVTLTADDGNGNTSDCTATVTVSDSTSPTAVCQNLTVYLDGSGNTTITAGDVDGGSSDNCSLAGISVTPSSFTCANVGANTVTFTATDVNGNTSNCTSTVTVIDSVAPTAVCQDITVFLDGSGNASITAGDIDNGSSDNCGVAGISVTPSSFTCANVGANTVTLTATDASGNTSDCTATVTVIDSISPTAVCQNITVFLDGSGNASIVAADIDGGSTDNCGTVSLTASQTAFTCANVGTNTVTLTADDGNGNTSDCTATVTVSDSTSPTAVCQNLTVYLDGSGNTSITAGDVDGGSSDNCSLAGISVTPSTFTCANAGANTVTLTATDVNGNTASCSATVTVIDSVAPTAVCQNLTVYLDGSGTATITAGDVDNGSSDNCGLAGISVTPSTFTCANVGANTVTLIATDANGNTSDCTATVTVIDSISPTAVCQNITVFLDGSGNASIVAADIDGGSTDNCGTVSLTASQTAFTCANVGTNTVTLTADDGNGNTSDCTATVTVSDSTSPTPDVATLADVTAECEVTSLTAPTATDNCGERLR